MLRRLLILSIFLALLGCGILYAAKRSLIYVADKTSEDILLYARRDNPVSTAKNATRIIYDEFSKGGYVRNTGRLISLRPVLTNRYMPEIFRVPQGAIELSIMEGWCDDASRALIYVLAKENIPAKQWNMQGPVSAHAAVVADFNGHTALLDPFYGFYSIKDGIPVAPKDAMKENALIPFDNRSENTFYDDYKDLFMGPAGEPLTITAQLPSEKVVLGKFDRNSSDIRSALGQYRMTRVWDYIGHKYDRAWKRELVATAPVRMDFILTRTPNSGVLRTLSPPPEVDGTKLSWHLLKGQKIISEDGKAGISLLRMNSYIDIDQIIITPDNGTRGDTP